MMERRMRGNSHVRCEVGENLEITSKDYLSLYNIIKGLSKKGLAVLLISSDMEEIIELSDRAVTIHQGRLNCEFDRADINQENLTKASFGVIGKEKES